MITLASPRPHHLSDLAGQAGAFLWWYADLSTSDGTTLVLIWSLGLPFLPDRGAEPPLSRPALSLAMYRGGRSDFYLLQDYGRADCSTSLGTRVCGDGHLGGTRFHTSSAGGAIELTVQLDEPIPGSRQRVTGTFHLVGAEYATAEDTSAAPHLWAPRVVHGDAHASLLLAGQRVELAGTGYFDSNFGRIPLEQQKIARWLWGRVSFADRTFAYYRTEGSDGAVQTRVVSQGRGEPGTAELTEIRASRVRRGWFGLKAPRELALRADGREFQLELGSPLEDGPFYQRFAVRARDDEGRTGRGVAEVVLPGRIDVPWQRPLVRMRTHVVGAENSFWLPLFSGSRRGRVRRLLGLEAR